MPSPPPVRVRQLGSAVEVAASQVVLALANYGVLALSGRVLPASGFAALSAFYLLLNTVGRGVFAAVELELTRSVADARARGVDGATARRAAFRHTGVLAAVGLVALVACSPVLLEALGGKWSTVALLASGMASIALSYVVRGPLAGEQRYHRYTMTFVAEAVVGAAAATALFLAGVTALTAWVVVFALAPLASLAALVVPLRRSDTPPSEEVSRASTLGQFGWTAALLFAGQALWNLAPVIVAYRLAESPVVAAGFAAFAVVLRVPVLLFPAVQALLLPPITAMFTRGENRGVGLLLRRIWVGLGVLGFAWMIGAVLLAAPIVDLLFGAVGTAPSTAVVTVLALSALVGAAVQVLQIGLIAQRNQRVVAGCWIVGLVVLVGTAFAPIEPVTAASAGQLAGAVATTVVLAAALRRRPRRITHA